MEAPGFRYGPQHRIDQFAFKQQVGLNDDPPKAPPGDVAQHICQQRAGHRQKGDKYVTRDCRLMHEAGKFVHLGRGQFVVAAAADQDEGRAIRRKRRRPEKCLGKSLPR